MALYLFDRRGGDHTSTTHPLITMINLETENDGGIDGTDTLWEWTLKSKS